MKLDPGSTDEHPSVIKTSTPAILMVMIEVCVFTALLGLAMHALNGLQIVNGDVNAPGAEGVRDYMLRYMGQVFVGGALGPAFGHAFGFVVSIVFAMLLLSAVNTAIVDLIMVQFLMSRDREVPADRKSTRLNSSHSQISYAVFCLKKNNFSSGKPATRKDSAAFSERTTTSVARSYSSRNLSRSSKNRDFHDVDLLSSVFCPLSSVR